jgi:AraC family transcriptional regulator
VKKIALIAILLLIIFTLVLAFGDQKETQKAELIELQEVSPFTYCCIPHKGPFTEIEKVIGQLMQATKSQNIFPGGPMIGVYYNSPEEVKPEDLEWEIGFPVTPQVVPLAPLEKKQWTFTQVASAFHIGPYEKTGETIAKIYEWMKANHRVQSGPLLERYLTMPTPETKPEDLKTEIWVPCQEKKK